MQFTTQLPVVGMDIAKNVFQLHLVDPLTEEIKQVTTVRLNDLSERREAYWARVEG